jgi:glutamine amidotransferase
MITIIDYGVGNLGSIRNMLKKLGQASEITSDVNKIKEADKLILPGVGSFDYGMSKLHEYGFIEVLNEKVMIEKVPILGICLGVQLMTKSSKEGQLRGLGWFDAETVPFEFSASDELIIPHMGWNSVTQAKESKLFQDMYEESKFYFVHSFHLKANLKSDELLISKYGYNFVSALEDENVVGVQFHPEKSHKYGLKLLKNFAELY